MKKEEDIGMSTIWFPCEKCHSTFTFNGYVPEKAICIECGTIYDMKAVLEEVKKKEKKND